MFVLEIVVVYSFCVIGGFQTGLQWVVLAVLARKKQKCQAFGHVLYYWITTATLWVSYFVTFFIVRKVYSFVAFLLLF
jgi:hypothetical protein